MFAEKELVRRDRHDRAQGEQELEDLFDSAKDGIRCRSSIRASCMAHSRVVVTVICRRQFSTFVSLATLRDCRRVQVSYAESALRAGPGRRCCIPRRLARLLITLNAARQRLRLLCLPPPGSSCPFLVADLRRKRWTGPTPQAPIGHPDARTRIGILTEVPNLGLWCINRVSSHQSICCMKFVAYRNTTTADALRWSSPIHLKQARGYAYQMDRNVLSAFGTVPFKSQRQPFHVQH